MAFDSLETLFQNMGPTYAASMTGQREADQSLSNILNMQQVQSSTEGNQLSNLLKQRTMDSDVAKAAASAQEAQAKADTEGVNSRIAKATEAGKTRNAVTAEDITRMRQTETMAGQHIGAIMSSPNPEAAKQQLLASGQIPAESPLYRVIQTTPAAKLPAVFDKYRQYVASQSDEYIKEIAKQKEHNKGTEQVARINAQAGIDKANITAKKGSKDFLDTLIKTRPDTRRGVLEGVLASGVNPVTKEELTPIEQAYLKKMLEEDTALLNQKATVQAGQGAFYDPNKGMQPKAAPQLGTSPQRKPLSEF